MRTKKKAPQTLFGKQIQANPEAHLLFLNLGEKNTLLLYLTNYVKFINIKN